MAVQMRCTDLRRQWRKRTGSVMATSTLLEFTSAGWSCSSCSRSRRPSTFSHSVSIYSTADIKSLTCASDSPNKSALRQLIRTFLVHLWNETGLIKTGRVLTGDTRSRWNRLPRVPSRTMGDDREEVHIIKSIMITLTKLRRFVPGAAICADFPEQDNCLPNKKIRGPVGFRQLDISQQWCRKARKTETEGMLTHCSKENLFTNCIATTLD